MDDYILEMRSITKTFPGVKALEHVDFDVRRGEIHGICGENGAGKSTLMKVLSGVHPTGSYDGEIVFDGEPVAFNSIRDSEHVGIVIIHQELALVPYLSIAENIYLGNEVRGRNGLIDWNKANADAGALLRSVGLHENPVTPVIQLGVGKQQLVEIAKALSKDVRLLILDEPTAALNDTDSAHLLDLLRALQERGITCIMISHKLNEITSIADQVTVIRDGRTVETLDMAAGEVTQERIIRGMVGRDLDSFFPERESDPGDEVLRVEDWTVWHPTQDRKVVDGASLQRPRRRGRRDRRTHGRRTHRARDEHLRARPTGATSPAGCSSAASEIKARSVAEAIEQRHRLRDGGPQALRPQPHRRHPPQHLGRGAGQARRRGWVNGNEETKVAEESRQDHEHQSAERDVHRGQALRRQPAEGRALQVAVHRPRRPDPRRADPRHRRGCEVRDLHDHQPAGGGREGRARDLVGAAGAAGHLRPHLHALGGPDHRRAAGARGHPGEPHGAHDEGEGARRHDHDRAPAGRPTPEEARPPSPCTPGPAICGPC